MYEARQWRPSRQGVALRLPQGGDLLTVVGPIETRCQDRVGFAEP